MKLVIIIVVALIVLGGGAGGALYFLEIGPFAPPPLVDGQPAPEPEQKLVDMDNTSFMDMDTLVVPIIGQGRTKSYYLDIRIELATADRTKAAQQKVRLHDAYLRDMYVFLPQHMKKNKTVHLPTVKARLFQLAQQILGKDHVNDVLIQAAYER